MFRKKLASMVLVVVLLMSLSLTTVNAQSVGGAWGNITWNLNTQTGLLTLSGDYQSSPSAYFNSNDVRWRTYRSIISEIIVEEGVTSIGTFYFTNLISLERVTLPDSLRAIHGSTFTHTILEEIIIPARVTSIGGGAFQSNSRLKTVIFLGNAPELASNVNLLSFTGMNDAIFYYPENATGWDNVVNQPPYSGFNWVSYNPANGLPDTSRPIQEPVPTPTPEPIIQPTPTPAPEQPPTPPVSGNVVQGFECEPINVGVMLRWQPLAGGLGYRVYRSENPNDEGISISDFYITCNVFVDVNAKANTAYYYSVRQVISEARPLEGIREELSPPTQKIAVTTGNITGGNLIPPIQGAQRKFILMTLDDPFMSVNGVRQEIDAGRGTAPIILSNRTVVPIRAIIEAMDGNISWQASNSEITLNRGQISVIMWVDSFDININGSMGTIDVPPVIRNERTLVPIRFSAENLDCEVDWINSTRQIVIVYY